MKTYNIKGGVLTFTVFVSMVISVLLMSIILLGYYARLERINYKKRIQALRNLQSVEEWALARGNTIDYYSINNFNLFYDETNSVSVKRYPWGLFDLFYCFSISDNITYQSQFFIGHSSDSLGKSALYLTDMGRGLSMVGEASITGTSYLPKAGIRAAYIGRAGYRKEKLTDGLVKTSDDKTPELNLGAYQKYFSINNDFKIKESNSITSNFMQPFKNDTLLKVSLNKLNLTDSLIGMIHIDITTNAIFDSLGFTDNVIVSAKSIEFKNGFNGNGQFFAEDTIKVDSGVMLAFPTILMIRNDKGPAYIELGKDVKMEGVIILSGSNNRFYSRIIQFKSGSELKGMVYNNGLTSHFGNIKGHLTTERFLVKSALGIFENYLLDGKLDAALDSAYLFPDLWFTSNQKGIMKWLD